MTERDTNLRDARLHKALAHAPDRDALPAPGTRNTIKNIATGVMPTRARARFDAKIPWWKALWEKTGRAGRAGRGGHASGPWNAAFATLLLGGIITLIWQGQEVPEAVPDQRPAGQRVPDAALPAPAVEPRAPMAERPPAAADVPPAAVPAPAPTATKRADTALAKAPQPGPSPQQQRDQAAPASSKASISKAPASPAAPAPAPAAPTADLGAPAESTLRREAPALEKRESAAVGAPSADKSISDMAAAPQQAGKQGAAAAPSSPATAPAQPVAPDPAAAVARAPEPSPAPAAAPARAAPYAAAAPAPSAPGAVGSMAERIARNDGNNRSRRAMFPPAALTTADWVAADVLYQGRTIRLARPEAQNLVNRVLGLMAANPAAVPSARAADKAPATAAETTVETAVAKSGAEGGAPTLRLQLVDQNSSGAVPVAQLELRGTALRLQRAGQADVVGVLTPEAAAGLLAEVVRALPP